MDNFRLNRFPRKAMSKRNKSNIKNRLNDSSSKIDFYLSKVNSGSVKDVEFIDKFLTIKNESKQKVKKSCETVDFSNTDVNELKTFCIAVSPSKKENIELFFNNPHIKHLIKRTHHGKPAR